MSGEFKEVDIDNLKVSSYNIRRENKEAGVEQLAENISSIGMLHPIIVTKDNQIICGQRRYLACQRLGLKRVWAKVLENITPETARAMSLAEHFQRIDPSDEDIKNAIRELYKSIGSIRKTASMVGLSPQTIANILDTSGVPEVEEKLEEASLPEIKKRQVRDIIEAKGIEDEDEVETIVELAKFTPTSKLEEIKDVVKEGVQIDLNKVLSEVKQKPYVTITLSIPEDLYKVIVDVSKERSCTVQEVILSILRDNLQVL